MHFDNSQPNQPSSKLLGINHFLSAGVHLGHSVQEWFPGNAPFIHGERHGMHVLDLNNTYASFQRSLKFLKGVSSAGGSVCFIATDPDIARLLKVCLGEYPKNVGLVTRWFPGTLTNWSSIFGFVARAKEDPDLVSFRKSPKNFRRWQALKGLQNLTSCPDVLVLLHAKDHTVAIQEASQIKIPSIGIVDSNANGSSISYPI